MKVFFDTLGCPKNHNDSQVAKGILEVNNYTIVENPQEADIIIVNTCGFINDAKKESIEHIFDMCQYRDEGKKLIVSGCLSQRYHNELVTEMPEVDAFLGVNEYEKLPEILADVNLKGSYIYNCYDDELKSLPRKFDSKVFTATIKIAEGCNNRCAYCVIPSIRGNFRSKREEDIIAEAKELAKAGCKELILIAQDVTLYGIDIYKEYRLPKLLKELVEVEGIQWIRLMYCYEDRISDELISVMAEEDKICKYIDIPIQHCSNRVLRAMRRRSTQESITDTIDRLRTAIPNIHIRTTLIVGFPGEREEDFDQLIDFVEKEKFARLGVFAYSKEENTPAGEMENQIDDYIKEQRVDAIMRRQMEISFEANQQKIGKIFKVLVETSDSQVDNSYIGRTEYDAPDIDNAIVFTSNRKIIPGEFVNVLINDAFDYDLVGQEVYDELTK